MANSKYLRNLKQICCAGSRTFNQREYMDVGSCCIYIFRIISHSCAPFASASEINTWVSPWFHPIESVVNPYGGPLQLTGRLLAREWAWWCMVPDSWRRWWERCHWDCRSLLIGIGRQRRHHETAIYLMVANWLDACCSSTLQAFTVYWPLKLRQENVLLDLGLLLGRT